MRTFRPSSRCLGAVAAAALLASPFLFPELGEAQQAHRPHVTIVATGGTIAGTSTGRTTFQSYRAGQLPIDDMVDELRPEIEEVAELSTVQFGNRGSGGYAVEDYYDLTHAVEEALETSDAVVVTVGTTTMEEFAYWLDLTVQSPKPVVLTGAMRPWTVVGTDAHANLFNAIVLAASGRTTCFGSVILMNDEIHAAKEAWKADDYRMDTFTSRRIGILGYVDELQVRVFRAPPRIQHCDDPTEWNTPFDLTEVAKEELPRTEIVIGYQGAGGEAITAFADAGVEGIVVAGGGGAIGSARQEAMERGVVFASTSRFRSGRTNLMPQKARLLLLLSLAFTDDPEQVDEWLTRYGAAEFEMNHRP